VQAKVLGEALVVDLRGHASFNLSLYRVLIKAELYETANLLLVKNNAMSQQGLVELADCDLPLLEDITL